MPMAAARTCGKRAVIIGGSQIRHDRGDEDGATLR